MRKVGFILLTIIMVALVVGKNSYTQLIAQPLNIQAQQEYRLPAGQGAIQTLEDFESNGWLPMPMWVARLWLKLNEHVLSIQAGTYAFTVGTTVHDAFKHMQKGNVAQFEVSLVEGLTYTQWVEALQTHPKITPDIDQHVILRLIAQWQPYTKESVTSIEGLLMADTYHFIAGTPASDILQRASDAMQDYLLTMWDSRDTSLPYETPLDVITMASIIEKETGLASERPRIAGVFINRLDLNMLLQTDPTVIYGIGEHFDGNLTRKHLRQDTPYNTYVHKGLPPGPIAMVGKAAIQAALGPTVTSDLYFVAKGDGSHQFSQTLQQHNAAVRKYQLKYKD